MSFARNITVQEAFLNLLEEMRKQGEKLAHAELLEIEIKHYHEIYVELVNSLLSWNLATIACLNRAQMQVNNLYLALPLEPGEYKSRKTSNHDFPTPFRETIFSLEHLIEVSIKEVKLGLEEAEKQRIRVAKEAQKAREAQEAQELYSLIQEHIEVRVLAPLEQEENRKVERLLEENRNAERRLEENRNAERLLAETTEKLLNLIFSAENINLLEEQVSYRAIGGGKALPNKQKIPDGAHSLITQRGNNVPLERLIERAKLLSKQHFLGYFKPIGRTTATQKYYELISLIDPAKINDDTLGTVKQTLRAWRDQYRKPQAQPVSANDGPRI